MKGEGGGCERVVVDGGVVDAMRCWAGREAATPVFADWQVGMQDKV